jgi:hypothetical protein
MASPQQITLTVPAELVAVYDGANRRLAQILGFEPGVPNLMVLSLTKDPFGSILDDFGAGLRQAMQKAVGVDPTPDVPSPEDDDDFTP